MAFKVKGVSRGVSGLSDRGEHMLRRGQHFTQTLFDGWTTFGNRMVSASKAASASPSLLPEWLCESAAAVFEVYGAALDASMSLVDGTLGCSCSETIAFVFDSDAEMAGPAVVVLPPGAAGLPPVPGDLTLVGGSVKIPAAHVMARTDGCLLMVTLVNLKPPISLGLVPGQYTGQIAFGPTSSVAVTATYTQGCSNVATCAPFDCANIPCVSIRLGPCGSCD